MRLWSLGVQSPALMRLQGLVGEAAGGRRAGPGGSGGRASSLSRGRNRLGAGERGPKASLPHGPCVLGILGHSLVRRPRGPCL